MVLGSGGARKRTLAVLPRYTRRAASSRVRQFAFLDRLKADGHPIALQSLLPDSYLDSIYGLRASFPYSDMAFAYARRARFMTQLPSGTIAWVEKEVFPKLPAAADLAALRRCSTTILDLDDAWFLTYGRDARPSAGNKIERLIRRANIVTVANQTMAEEVSARGARDVRLFAPCIDTRRFVPPLAGEASGPPVIGWIGTPLNATTYLPPLVPVLNDLSRRGRARIVLVGAGSAVPELGAERRDWSEETEVADVAGFDIGIMPLADTLWNRCKSGFKLLQTMACGRLAMGSAVGLNRDIIVDGENGVLVPACGNASAAKQNWATAFDRVLDDEALRARLGRSARETVIRRYDMATRENEISAFFAGLA